MTAYSGTTAKERRRLTVLAASASDRPLVGFLDDAEVEAIWAVATEAAPAGPGVTTAVARAQHVVQALRAGVQVAATQMDEHGAWRSRQIA